MSALNLVLIFWGIVTAALAGLLIYRATVSMKEDDQLFLSEGQKNLEREQREVRNRLDALTPYTRLLGATSGVLLTAGAGIWIYQAIHARTLP